ncbi:MAG: amidohydrolase family protein, partial [Acidimicrobiia bacterium]
MYSHDGQPLFVVDTHVHFWDASPANQLNRYGAGFIECFYNFHAALSPPEYVWSAELFGKYPEERIMKDLFEEGYVDKAILMPTYLTDFFRDGFNTIEQDAVMKKGHPGEFI